MKIPEGTQSGRQFRLKSRACRWLRSRNIGDLHVQVDVETPQNLTKRQRELLMEFEKNRPERRIRIDRILLEDEGPVREDERVVIRLQLPEHHAGIDIAKGRMFEGSRQGSHNDKAHALPQRDGAVY